MEKLKFDVMLRGRFVCTLVYEHCPAFALTAQEIVDFVLSKRPTLKNQPFNIVF
jgi:hypothetical protein